MKTIQIVNHKNKFDNYLIKNTIPFYIKIKEKNIISYIYKSFYNSNNNILISQHICGYFLYYASSLLKKNNNTNSIVINPLFFGSNNNIISPPTNFYNNNNIKNNIVILTDNFKYFDKTIKIIKDNGNKYFIIKEHELLKTLTQIENDIIKKQLTQIEKKPKGKISGMTKEISIDLKKIK
jgi:hypothetical protein